MVDILGINPEYYWTREMAEEYDSKKNIKKTQERMTHDLLSISEKKGLVLDAGCGTGFSTKIISESFDVIGFDVSFEMCRLAKNKKLNVLCASFFNIPFKSNIFELVVSVSALQWVFGKDREELILKYSDVLSEFNRVLKRNGEVLLQFYPNTKSEYELFLSLAKKFFTADEFESGVGRKRKDYLKLIKKN